MQTDGFIISVRWVLPLETVPFRRAGQFPGKNIKNLFGGFSHERLH